MSTPARWADFGPDDLIADSQTAELLGVSVHTVRSWRAGDDPRGPRFVRVGGHVRYRIADLRKYVERNIVSTSDDPITPAPTPNLRSLRKAS